MKIKEQTRKLVVSWLKGGWDKLTKVVSYTYGKVKLTRFEEIFEEYKTPGFSYS
ncbi:chlorohydrolase [Streptococcus pneumoniae]|nr:chlorohydrolase [Streptococcus pneumoniae]